MEEANRRYWRSVLKATGNNVSAAARVSGCHHTAVHRIIKRLGVHQPQVRKATRWHEHGL